MFSSFQDMTEKKNEKKCIVCGKQTTNYDPQTLEYICSRRCYKEYKPHKPEV